ncbi:methyltransferase domain-containing protein [Nitrospirillum sp. BR 11164]|uniref:class I SAM-dependent methyltransferase n=1 Tax=Nitrospirillum sp. BR 11164 TaxID=3104324 RepID=UPI002AFF9567|nr:methyltransferase domain-containing protein [Nitrospirillum sp. BR 11164]MEA1647581.1 methyltransferase domain-containing protein [Nitrospirillum sp. BR 11164]
MTLDTPVSRTVLHVGCGIHRPDKLHSLFLSSEWREVRLDIDPSVQPDIVASITDLSMVADGSVDAVWSSHNVEHLHAHQVPVALAEFRRVLKPDGFVLITLPDLQAVAALVVEDRLDETVYMSPAGPVAPLDMLFGLRSAIARGNEYMAHRTGFTAQTLGKALLAAGFAAVKVTKDKPSFNLWAIAYVTPPAGGNQPS